MSDEAEDISALDIEEIWRRWKDAPWGEEQRDEIAALYADWRAKKAEIERLRDERRG